MSRNIIVPTYKEGFATCKAEAENPGLWEELLGWWEATLGPTGLTLYEWGSGKKLNGTLTNGPTWAATEMGWALNFNDAANQYVTIESPVVTSFPVTVVAWVKIDDLTAESTIFSIAEDGAEDAWLRMAIIGGKVRVQQDDGTTSTHNSTSSLTQNAWHLVAGVFDTKRLGTWLDLEYTESAVNDTFPAGVDWSTIGVLRRGASFDDYLSGQIVNIGAPNRILAPSEIQQLYADPHAIGRLRSRVFAAAVAAPTGGPFPHYIRRTMRGGMIGMGG